MRPGHPLMMPLLCLSISLPVRREILGQRGDKGYQMNVNV